MTLPVLASALDALRDTATRVSAEQLDNATPCTDWTVAQVLLHAAGDQHAWASTISTSPPPTYNPFAPATRLDGSIDELIDAAVQAASTAWTGVDGVESVPTPLPPLPTMTRELAAATCALDAAIHAWDIALATGQPSPLTPDLARQLRAAADATVAPLRGFAYGPALPSKSTDDPTASLLRHLGRNPLWTP